MQQAVTGTTPEYAPVSGGNEPGNSSDFTRRALFGAAGAIALAAAPVAALAAPTASANPSEWKRAFNAHRAADTAYDHFLDNVYLAADEELVRRAGPLPSLRFRVPRARGHFDEYEANPAEFDWLCADEEYGPLVRPVRDAWEARLAKREAAERDLGIAGLEEESERLGRRSWTAFVQLIETPAPDAEAVRHKLDLIWDRGFGDREDFQRLILTDLAALSGVAQ